MNFSRQDRYSRYDAVEYAVKYALKPNPEYRYFPLIGDQSGDCANFISQCLRAGGAPMSEDFNDSWWYNNNGTPDVYDDTWSVSWAVAHSLYWRLKINQESNYYGPKGLEVEDAYSLEPGDLIFFQDDTGKIFHSTIVTCGRSTYSLISQHSFEALNIPYSQSWPAYNLHFLKISV